MTPRLAGSCWVPSLHYRERSSRTFTVEDAHYTFTLLAALRSRQHLSLAVGAAVELADDADTPDALRVLMQIACARNEPEFRSMRTALAVVAIARVPMHLDREGWAREPLGREALTRAIGLAIRKPPSI